MRSLVCWMAAAAVLATPALAQDFEAGQWRHRTKLISAEVPGVSEALIKLVAGDDSRTSCSSAAELKANPESLMTGDPKAVCKLQTLSMKDGRVVFDTFCTNKRFPEGLKVSSRGSYTPTSYEISTTSTGTRKGKPVKILTTGTGTRAGACAKK